MLHFRYKALSLLALAIAVPGVSFSEPASAPFLSGGESKAEAASLDAAAMETTLVAAVQGKRLQAGVGLLQVSDSLSRVAQAHAIDMAERQYAADVSPEGLTLLDQVRLADRQSLFSTFGTAIAVVDAGTDAGQVLKALMSDPANAENIVRSSFDHTGIGVAEKNGKLFVVQLLARVDGQLSRPLPMNAGGVEFLRADFSARGMTPVSWSVRDEDGAVLLRGSGDRVRDSQGRSIEGYLNMDVALGQDVYTLRGPYVRMD
ncbi:CAP domain-containing protein [Hyphomonas sp. WL0036]|uniref:CAP domain-containing protein n=1 Tax=Hyphomonas sediminis TaxID=2866160 RepID=UPI001C81EE71|nr:CAP domain-containing protein [Hyphomonas sediminis]MBY9067679.1 CAP domain-containing protein [Hyphomonas sediminis]